MHLSEEWTSDPCGSRSTSVLRLPVVRGRRASVFAINAAGKAEILVRDIPADLEVNARAAAHECRRQRSPYVLPDPRNDTGNVFLG